MSNRSAVDEIGDEFADTIDRVADGGERIMLERHGKTVAAVVSLDDLALLEEMEDRLDVEAAKAALAESDERIPYEEARRRLGLT